MSMVQTTDYYELENRLNDLERHLMPEVKYDGHYTAKELDYIRAYRLLVHAEFEHYFEEITKKIVTSSLRNWLENGEVNQTLLSILAFVKVDFGSFPDSKDDKKGEKFNSLEKRLRKATSNFMAIINENHGIKEKNIVQLLLPLGLSINDVDQIWLNTINSFGKNRGEVAHRSAKVQQPINPSDELAVISRIKEGIRNIDLKLKGLMVEIDRNADAGLN